MNEIIVELRIPVEDPNCDVSFEEIEEYINECLEGMDYTYLPDGLGEPFIGEISKVEE